MVRKELATTRVACKNVVFYCISITGDTCKLHATDKAPQNINNNRNNTTNKLSYGNSDTKVENYKSLSLLATQQMSISCGYGATEEGIQVPLQKLKISLKTLEGSGLRLEPSCYFFSDFATIIYETTTMDATIISLKKATAFSAVGVPLPYLDNETEIESKRPCNHNDWDDVRTRKGFKTLRCRICLSRWKVKNTTPRCLAFLHDNCTDPDCEHIHVRRKKSAPAVDKTNENNDCNNHNSHNKLCEKNNKCELHNKNNINSNNNNNNNSQNHNNHHKCESFSLTSESPDCEAEQGRLSAASSFALHSSGSSILKREGSSLSLSWSTSPSLTPQDGPMYVAPYLGSLALETESLRLPSSILKCWSDIPLAEERDADNTHIHATQP